MSPLTPPPTSGSPPAERSVEALIREAQGGSPAAMGELLEGARKYLLMVANRELDGDLRAKGGASDLVQETLMHAHHDFGRFRGTSTKELFVWLVAILDHRVANTVRHFRGTKKRNVGREVPINLTAGAGEEIQDRHPTPGAAAVERDEEQRLQAALAQLSPPMREVLIERTWQGASFADIGLRRGCSAEAARKQWSRAVRQLERILNETSCPPPTII